MKRTKSDRFVFSGGRQRSFRMLIVLTLMYILLMNLEIPFVFKNGFVSVSQEGRFTTSKAAQFRTLDVPHQPRRDRKINALNRLPLSTLNFTADIVNSTLANGILKTAKVALELGRNLWQELEFNDKISFNHSNNSNYEECPPSVSVVGDGISKNGSITMTLPCGLKLGSHITVMGKLKNGSSGFMMELQGLKMVEGEDPPRIMHFNPRLKGDFSEKLAIELNSCYRMQWGMPQRCEGLKSRDDEETVDGYVKCEKWIRDDDNEPEEYSTTKRWLNWLIGRTKKAPLVWPFPFTEDKLFVLTLRADMEGYHINVDGKHITSFPHCREKYC